MERDELLVMFDDFCSENNIGGVVELGLTLDRPYKYLGTKLVNIGLEQHELDIFIDYIRKCFNIIEFHVTINNNMSVSTLINRIVFTIKRNKKNV